MEMPLIHGKIYFLLGNLYLLEFICKESKHDRLRLNIVCEITLLPIISLVIFQRKRLFLCHHHILSCDYLVFFCEDRQKR